MAETVFGRSVENHIQESDDLRAVIDAPSHYVTDKVIDHIDPLAERFIAASPLVILATRRADGGVDQTPRGDPAGSVNVLGPKLLAMGDRPGNRRMDAIENILRDPAVALLFLIPGHGDTLRIGGRAAVVEDAKLARKLSVNDRPAGLVLLIEVDFLLCHCPKALIRSHAWKPDKWPDTSDVPSLSEMMIAHGKLSCTEEHMDELIHVSNTERLY